MPVAWLPAGCVRRGGIGGLLVRNRALFVGVVLFCASGCVLAAASAQLWEVARAGAVVGDRDTYSDALALLNTQTGNPYVVCTSSAGHVNLRQNLQTCAQANGSIWLKMAWCTGSDVLSSDWLTCAAATASESDPVGVLGLKLSDLMAAVMIGLLVLVYVGGLAVGQQR